MKQSIKKKDTNSMDSRSIMSGCDKGKILSF